MVQCNNAQEIRRGAHLLNGNMRLSLLNAWAECYGSTPLFSSHLLSTLASAVGLRPNASRSAESKRVWILLSLTQHFAAILDVDALLHLRHTLTTQVVDSTRGTLTTHSAIDTTNTSTLNVLEHGVSTLFHGA